MSSLSGNVQPSNRTFVCLVNFHARGPVGGGAVDPESSRTQEPSVFWCLDRQHSRELNQVPCHGAQGHRAETARLAREPREAAQRGTRAAERLQGQGRPAALVTDT